jgi:hypothetical protein
MNTAGRTLIPAVDGGENREDGANEAKRDD